MVYLFKFISAIKAYFASCFLKCYTVVNNNLLLLKKYWGENNILRALWVEKTPGKYVKI